MGGRSSAPHPLRPFRPVLFRAGTVVDISPVRCEHLPSRAWRNPLRPFQASAGFHGPPCLRHIRGIALYECRLVFETQHGAVRRVPPACAIPKPTPTTTARIAAETIPAADVFIFSSFQGLGSNARLNLILKISLPRDSFLNEENPPPPVASPGRLSRLPIENILTRSISGGIR